MEFALVIVIPQADHPVVILNLIGINDVDLFAAVLLTREFSRAVVMDGLLHTRTGLAHGQRRLILIAPDDHALPAGLLRSFPLVFLLRFLLGGSLLRLLLL